MFLDFDTREFYRLYFFFTFSDFKMGMLIEMGFNDGKYNLMMEILLEEFEGHQLLWKIIIFQSH